MRQLPDLPNLDQLRHQARELQRASQRPVALSKAQLAIARQYGFPSWAKLTAEVNRRRAGSSRAGVRSITIRPVASVDELVQAERVIARQFPPRRSAPAHGLGALKSRFEADRTLMLVATIGDRIVGGALALRVGDAVKVDVIALEPDVRRTGIGRRLMDRIELEAIRLGARGIYLGGANAENRAFYWQLGFRGRRSLMQKGLPVWAHSRIEPGGMDDESEHRSDV